MTAHDAILAAVLGRPDDDTPRLVYADYLDDVGEHARAAFIRVHVKLGRIPEPKYTGLRVDWDHPPRYVRMPECLACRPSAMCEYHEAERAACVPWNAGVGAAMAATMPGGNPWPTSMPIIHAGPPLRGVAPDPDEGRTSCEIRYFLRRGWVDSILCPAADWLAHGSEILAAHPVRVVTLTTDPTARELAAEYAKRDWSGHRYLWQLSEVSLAELWPGIAFTLPPPARTADEAWEIEVRTPDVWAGGYRLPGMAEGRLRGVVPGDVPPPLVGSVIGPFRARSRDGRVYHVPRAVVTETNITLMLRGPDMVDVAALTMGEFRDVTGEPAPAAPTFVVLEPRA